MDGIINIYKDYIRFDYHLINIRINDFIEKTDDKLIIESNFMYLDQYFFDVPFTAIMSFGDSREVLYISINKIDILRNYCDRSDIIDDEWGSICLFPTFKYQIDYELLKVFDLKDGYTNEFLDFYDIFSKDTNKKYGEKEEKYLDLRKKEDEEYDLLEKALEKAWIEYKKSNNLVFVDQLNGLWSEEYKQFEQNLISNGN